MTDFPRDAAASLDRSIRDLTAEIKELRAEFASTYARKDVIEPRIADVEADVKRHGDYFEWIVKTVVGAVVLALLGLVLVQNGVIQL